MSIMDDSLALSLFYCTVLHYVAVCPVCGSVLLQCVVAVCCILLHCLALCGSVSSVWQCVVTVCCCSVLYFIALSCTMWQCVAVCGSVLQCVPASSSLAQMRIPEGISHTRDIAKSGGLCGWKESRCSVCCSSVRCNVRCCVRCGVWCSVCWSLCCNVQCSERCSGVLVKRKIIP